ncbi:MAG: glycerol kinase GlpK, partial [Spirochaetales bacterium]|nr:glycerol kinase GlpK [Spirochaetales bacterium]MCF7939270.1 glycerol kinase GlpK [Spirochaetales bacterium]
AVVSSQTEHKQYFPKAGWVEHDPIEIWENTCRVIRKTLRKAGAHAESLAAAGITNQRETTVVWDRTTGKPLHNAIVWQDTRTSELVAGLEEHAELFRRRTGLPPATYFSGPKLRWILDNAPGVRRAAEEGRALFGTIDTWLIWKLTGGEVTASAKPVSEASTEAFEAGVGPAHITDVTNASRTMLMNLETLEWDEELLEVLNIPPSMLPEIHSSSEPASYGLTRPEGPFAGKVPLTGILGDQQAALFGQTCYQPGEAKCTYGTGGFLLLNTGGEPVRSEHGLLTTVGYRIGHEPAVYALEGSIAVAGSLVQWFRDNLKMISSAPEINDLAAEVSDSGGIYIVPAFSGLFAPYWKPGARGVIAGLTHYITREHLARAVLEATAYQVAELIESMEKDSGDLLSQLRVDGGMTASEILMQFQADILGAEVVRPKMPETTALGAAYAAGLAVGFWKDQDELTANWSIGKEWKPSMSKEKRDRLMQGWKKAVRRTIGWVEAEIP